jgi:hypothetical protein
LNERLWAEVFVEGEEYSTLNDEVERRGDNNRKLGFYFDEKGIHSHLPTTEVPRAFLACKQTSWHGSAFLFREVCSKSGFSSEIRDNRGPLHREI